MSSKGSDQNWNRPWSMNEIIENAENWSLAGDVALLNTIKSYADNLLSKTLTISDSVDGLLNELDEVGLRLDITHNEFQSLRNTQFIESRVYEDDETLDVQETKEKEREYSEEEKQRVIREAVQEGLDIMDRYFEKYEVSISDSEEEAEEKSYVLKPKDLYADRPLPLVIGTDEWYKKWHVGLADSSSESESEKESESYSESDSEDHLPKDLMKGSETSSELDFPSQTGESRPMASSTFDQSTKQSDIFESDDSDEQVSLPVKTPTSNKNFAEQLAEKLGNVVSEREVAAEEVNKRPIQTSSSKKFGDLFSDEPPPIDDFEDTVLQKSVQSGLFSGGQGLFDDVDDKFSDHEPNLPKDVQVKNKTQVKQEAQSPENRGVSLSARDFLIAMIAAKTICLHLLARSNRRSRRFCKRTHRQPPLFNDEPPELETPDKQTEDTAKRKPFGGVSILGSANIFAEQKIKNILKSQPDIVKSDAKDTETEANMPRKVDLFQDDDDHKAAPKKISLFDEDDDLFKDDLFSKGISSKTNFNLFDDTEDIKEDLFARETVRKVDLFSEEDSASNINDDGKSKKADISLFNDEDQPEKEECSPIMEGEDQESKEAAGQAGHVTQIILEDDSSRGNIINSDIGERQVIGAETKSSDKNITSELFDDGHDKVDIVVDDLFGTNPTKSEPKSTPPDASIVTRRSEGVNLFGTTPPPDDDIWDTKSDNFSDGEDQFSYRFDSNAGGSSLFDNEPPFLGPDESSGIVRDHNITRVDTDDSSFYPYASSSRRLSSDIFSEQQSQDRLFVTNSKTESINVAPPQLDIIHEDPKVSYVDITPSGNLDDLDDSKEDSVFVKEPRLEPERPLSLFDSSDNDFENLFLAKAEIKSLPKLSGERLSLFDNTDDVLVDEIEKTAPTDAPSEKKDEFRPNKTVLDWEDDEGRLTSSTAKVQAVTDKPTDEHAGKRPISDSPLAVTTRRLRHNLNINVSALLPGRAPPRPKDLSKSHGGDVSREEENITTGAPYASSPPQAVSNVSAERAVSFDDDVDGVRVLHSITKDRVRIPIKRRPSTRRGRREAIGRSEIGATAGRDGNIASPLDVRAEKPSPENPSKEASETIKQLAIGLAVNVKPLELNSKLDGAEQIFAKGALKEKPKQTLFSSDDDSDGGLFAVPGKDEADREGKPVTTASKKALFNDSSSDDDFFSTTTKQRVQPTLVEKKKQMSTLRKLKNIETDDDPLSSLLK
ncbi:hypothetical protein NQ317_015522 [Molorchus minor]|uniref:FAM21/CAPZIP domain-containing protein n=1 Tax=Molorchus minor TaxID=1323400 RepID=A0ABQ9JM78_9CUCU|nr:hypothetical protein NQ317_015522 [Molorchus minor]